MDTLIDMKNKELVLGLPKIKKDDSVCEGCISGKHARKPFQKKMVWQATEPLQLVHSDICGPMRTESIGGCRYFITFIDDYTRKTWVYFLKFKYEALYHFKNFRVLNEKQSNHVIKTLRTDRGGEYCSKSFQEYLRLNGIRHQLTNSYTPQQNGVAERKNRTLMELSRSMMNLKQLPNCYWAEAVACTTYILNRTITKTRPNITPFEAWNGQKPNVEHLRVFGCLAYALVPKQHRDKLSNKTIKTIFVGYSEASKGYKLYDPQTNKIIISRDVIFDENKRWVFEGEGSNVPFVITDGEEIQTQQDGEKDKNREQESDNCTTDNINGEQNQEDTNNDQQACSDSGTDEAQQRGADQDQQNNGDTSSTDSENEVIKTKSIRNIYRNTRKLSNAEVLQKYNQNQVVNFVLYASTDPTSYEEASKDAKWIEAMDREMDSINKNHTWVLVDPPKHQKPIGVKWIYKTKYDEKGNVDKYKARLVVKGYRQKYGIDYQEVFAPVIRFETVRIVLALAAHYGWYLHQMDVKTAFLNGKLNEQVYIEQPQGYIKHGEERKVCHLQRALYGLKQAPRAWYSRIDSYFLQNKFKKSAYEHTLYIKDINKGKLVICLYVDDLIIASNSMHLITKFKESMNREFEMTDMGRLHYFLGMEVLYEDGNIILSQRKYMKNLLDKYKMTQCNTVSTPMEYGLKLSKDDPEEFVDEGVYRSLIGSLMYLTNTRPDIMFAVSKVSRFMESPRRNHWEAAK
ncbi:putative RNA-directed DNA polymerase [Helianthus annuus]|nr:putative RNA-directed DNA polymerase [Helianthus annuus]